MNLENSDSHMERKKDRRTWFFLFDGIFLLLLGVYIFWGMVRVPFHGDESTLIRMSMDFAYIFEDHAIQNVVYNPNAGDRPVEQETRKQTGAIDPLTIGLAWTIAGMDRSGLNGFWIWYPPGRIDEWTYNALRGNLPDTRLLDIARIPSTLFMALSIVVVFVIALGLSRSRPAAWIAAFLYATTPSILVNGRRAMQEGALLLFTSLVVLCALFLLQAIRERNLHWRRILLGYGLLGLFSGLALASKHTSVLIIAPMYLVVFILLWSGGKELDPRERKVSRFHLLAGAFGSGLLGISVFYILTPIWWFYRFDWLILMSLSAVCFLFGFPKPGSWIWFVRAVPIAMLLLITVYAPPSWSGIYQPVRIIYQSRENVLQSQESQGRTMPTLKSRIRMMVEQLLFAKTQYYESFLWDDLPEEQAQIRIYEASHLDGRGGGTVWGIVILALAVGGLWVTLFRRRGWGTLFLYLWFVIPAAILLVTNPLAWQRYYIILIAPWSVLAGFAAVPIISSDFLGSVRKFLARRSSVAKSE
jgi:hypothetical protein